MIPGCDPDFASKGFAVGFWFGGIFGCCITVFVDWLLDAVFFYIAKKRGK